MSRSNLDSTLKSLQESDDNITTLDDGWSQGRSAFGGISAAFAMTAMRKLVPYDLPLRSLSVSFIAPVPPGKVLVETKIIRKGKSVIQTEASLVCNDNICLRAMAAFGYARETYKIPPNKSFKPKPRGSGVKFEDHAKQTPGFLQFFEGEWVNDGMPFAGKLSRKLELWVRHNIDLDQFPAEKLITICDIPPPVILSHFSIPPVPSSSLTWSLEFVIPPEKVSSDWFFLEFFVDAAANGYTQQSGNIYDEEGRLCALSRQCMVYFS